MAYPKRAVPRVGVLTRFEPDQLAAIDAARGETPRTVWIVDACMIAAHREPVAPRKAAPGRDAVRAATTAKIEGALNAGRLRGFSADGSPIYR
ncbi:MAG: hypothetical protein ACREQ5_13005 [Candidatus Dormibacteria bacterium]